MKLLFILFSFMTQSSDTVLVGKQNISDVKNNAACTWLNSGIYNYKTDKNNIENLKSINWKDYKFVVVCGSWCEDTHTLLPKFVAVAEQVNLKNIEYYFVDIEKKSPENAKENFKVDRIPTFIIYKNGKELGRIIETITEPFEQVLETIVLNN